MTGARSKRGKAGKSSAEKSPPADVKGQQGGAGTRADAVAVSDKTKTKVKASRSYPAASHASRKQKKSSVPRIAALGASAGGLEALEHFFDALPADLGMTFVVVQHLSPDFPSMMNQILARRSRMPIATAEAGQVVETNTVYLRPAKETLIFVRLHSS